MQDAEYKLNNILYCWLLKCWLRYRVTAGMHVRIAIPILNFTEILMFRQTGSDDLYYVITYV